MLMRSFYPFFSAPRVTVALGVLPSFIRAFRTCINYLAFSHRPRFPATAWDSFSDDSRAPRWEVDGGDTKRFSHLPGLKMLVPLASGFYFGVFQVVSLF